MEDYATLIENKIIVDEKRSIDRLIQKGFGERQEKDLVLDLKEAVYLIDKGDLEVKKTNKKVSYKKLFELGESLDKKFYSTYLVFKDLRDRGFVVKTGLKFGFPLRVYPRGKKPGEEHTQWVINVSTQEEIYSMPELSRMVRLARNLNTVLLQAVVDSENDINYYETKRITP